ncbi:MAG: IPT/TIG domain-containing protein [Gemmatimonadota bacterium]
MPTAFNGTISPATATVGQAITVSGTSLFGFNPDSVAVTVDGLPAVVVSATTSQVVFAPPTASGGVVNINGLTVLGNIYIGSMDAATTITVTETSEPANDGPPGATVTPPTAVGSSVEAYGVVDGPCGWDAACGADQGVGDLDDFFTFTTPAGPDSLNYQVEVFWSNDAIDIDAFVLNAAGGGFCVIDGCAGATGSDPELMDVRLAPGTSYTINVDVWNTHGEATPTAYRVKITRLP